MKKNILVIISVLVFIVSGCADNSEQSSSKVSGGGNNVDDILEQQIAASEATSISEDVTDLEEDDDTLSETEASTASTSFHEAEKIDVAEDYIDLTQLSATMVYTTVYNMVYYPENFVGKTVKMKGSYSEYVDEQTGIRYFGCIIQDATACCEQGIEFELTDDYKYPDDYPKEADEVVVEGVFETYKEGEYTYCVLRNAKLCES